VHVIFPLQGSLGPLGQKFGAAAAQNQDLIDLVDAFWKLDEASGSRVDSGPNGLTLTDTGSVGSGAGHVYPTAALFTGSTAQKLGHADDAALQGFATSYTWAAWLKPTSTGTFQAIMSKETPEEYDIYVDHNGGSPRLRVDMSTIVLVGGSGDLAYGSWHLAIVWNDKAAGVTHLQVDNGTVYDSTVHGSVASGTAPFAIGRLATSVAFAASGLYGPEMKFHDVLDASQRPRLWNAGAGLPLY
jgi:hypothetical protein